MEKEPISCLMWRGWETIEKVKTLLDHSERIEIELPNNYNHVLFRALHPNESPAATEKIHASAGPELLLNIASVQGLEKLATLTELLHTTQATVQVISPPKLIITFPSEHDINQ